jgi:hypothetical protein
MKWFRRRNNAASAQPNGYPYGGLPSTVPGGQYTPPPTNTPGFWNANDLPGAAPLGIPNDLGSQGYLDAIGVPQPLPADLISQATASPSTRYTPYNGHSFVRAGLPDPGAPAWTFDALALAEFSPIGAGIMNQGEILALEGAPTFQNLQVVTNGLGGIVQGELVIQPLMLDPVTTALLQDSAPITG